MTVEEKIQDFINHLPEPKRNEIAMLHQRILTLLPGKKLCFETGVNEEGKVVSNPNIGYGNYTIHYANGTSRDFFQIGLSPNQTGISVYIMGLKDKGFLSQRFGTTIGKAKLTGYCIRFKSINDIQLSVLEEAIREGVFNKR